MPHFARRILLGAFLVAARLHAGTPTEDAPPAPTDSAWQARAEAAVGSRAFAAGPSVS